MKNLKVAQKFLVSFGIITALILGVIGYTLFSLNQSATAFNNFYSGVYQISNTTYSMRIEVQAASKNFANAILAQTKEETQKYIDKGNEYIQHLKDDVDYIKKNASTDELKKANDELFDILTASAPIKEEVLIAAIAQNDTMALRLYFEQYEPKLLEAQGKVIDMDNFTKNVADVAFAANQKIITIAFAILCVLSVFLIGFVVFIGVYLTKSITNPLLEMEKVSKQMSEGSLNVEVNYKSKDEIGALADSVRILVAGVNNIIKDMTYGLDEMAKGNFAVQSNAIDDYVGDYLPLLDAMKGINENLSSTLSEINVASEQVNMGSDQVSGGAQELSQGATQQASAIEELSATIAEVSEKIKINADNAVHAGEVSDVAGAGVSKSNEKMRDLTKAMTEITETSNEISKIIKTIDDIAFQTNILALNAAVEAARAGEAGKGFAVVADEVRNLAGKSAEAAKNTTILIENAINAISNGSALADETASFLENVVVNATEVNNMVQQIANASEAQATAVNQITQGVEQISSVVQTNSATAEESAAASEELSGQATMLKQLVGQFKLKDTLNKKSFDDNQELLNNDLDNDYSFTDSKY